MGYLSSRSESAFMYCAVQKNSVPAAAGAVATSHTVFLLNIVDLSYTHVSGFTEVSRYYPNLSSLAKSLRVRTSLAACSFHILARGNVELSFTMLQGPPTSFACYIRHIRH